MVRSRLFFYGYLYTKNYQKAHKMVNYIMEKDRRKIQSLRLSGILSALEGDSTSALAYTDSLTQLSTKVLVSKVFIASVYAAVGDSDNMYRNLDLAL